MASSKARRLTISDVFFHPRMTQRRRHAILHELVHIADPCCEMAYSKDWIEYALPLITDIKSKSKLVLEESRGQFQEWIKLRDGWLSIYASENLREAFAEYICFAIESKAKAHNSKRLFLSSIENPSNAELKHRLQLSLIAEQIETKQLGLSSKALEEALKCFKQNPCLGYLLAFNCEKKKRKADSLVIGEAAISKFKELGVDSSEEWFDLLLNQQAKLRYEGRQYSKAAELLCLSLTNHPNNKIALCMLSKCLESQGNHCIALQALYRSRGYSPVDESLCIVAKNTPLVMALGTLIERDSQSFSHEVNARMANLFKTAAERAKTVEEKNFLRTVALKCLSQVVSQKHPEGTDKLLSMAEIQVENGNYSLAKEYVKEALTNNPEYIPARLAHLLILEKQGISVGSKPIVKRLHQEISELPEHTARPVENSLRIFDLETIIAVNKLQIR